MSDKPEIPAHAQRYKQNLEFSMDALKQALEDARAPGATYGFVRVDPDGCFERIDPSRVRVEPEKPRGDDGCQDSDS